MTHPFHPLTGQQLVCVGERYNRYGTRLLLRVGDETVCSVPPQWTDAVAPDPEVVIGERRALLRVADLLGLAELVERLANQQRCPRMRKVKDVVFVTPTSPLVHAKERHLTAHRQSKEPGAKGAASEETCRSGVIVVTNRRSEAGCRNETNAKTRRRRPSSRTER